MKIKTSELIDLALDWSVGEIEFNRLIAQGSRVKQWILDDHVEGLRTDPYSTNWSLGGPIIEREKIRIEPSTTHSGWFAVTDTGYYALPSGRHYADGPTPLTAAMRCYVASKLGDEIEIPDVLVP